MGNVSPNDPFAGDYKMGFIAIGSKQAPVFAVERIVGEDFQYGFILKEDVKRAGKASLNTIDDQTTSASLEKQLEPLVEAICALHVPLEVGRNVCRIHSPASRVIKVATGDNCSSLLHDAPGALHMQRKLSYLFGIAEVVANRAPFPEGKPHEVGSSSS